MDTNHRRRELHFLMPFIDFAFMVIIIFVGLLSMAYFEPPGSAGVKRQKSLFTDNDVSELKKLGLTPSQIKELVVIRAERNKKFQDTQSKLKGHADRLKRAAAKSFAAAKNISSMSLPSSKKREEKPFEKRLKKENVLLEKKVALLEKQLSQVKKQMLALQSVKKTQKNILKPVAATKEKLQKEIFGGHEFLDLRK